MSFAHACVCLLNICASGNCDIIVRRTGDMQVCYLSGGTHSSTYQFTDVSCVYVCVCVKSYESFCESSL